ncbi:type I glyceraldehyde-3-phosphate dehydrogenase [Candidatus Micrarchaeota archaeon]|nr:type I glyceraldehyde-3-phosphate dehydrogenase [Candidatus Micrarchaeota archaeon]
MKSIVINGFGRIGRNVLKSLYIHDMLGTKVDVVALNLHDPEQYAYLFKHDSTYGTLDAKVTANSKWFNLDGYKIKVVNNFDPEKLPWDDIGVDTVVESTGVFRDRKGASKHLTAGAKKVLITAPATDPDITIVPGVNDKMYNKAKHNIVSLASCTTNSIAPPLKVIDERFGIVNGFLTTVHAYTNDQVLLDKGHRKDWRRARSAAINTIPTSTGAAKAIGEVLPKLKGKLDGMAIRVPVPTGSISDLTLNLKTRVSVSSFNDTLKTAAKKQLKGIMEYTEDPIVSSDIIGNDHSSIIDGMSTKIIGKTVKFLAWYDNEWGYSCRVAEFIARM